MRDAFLDTAFAVALASPTDQHHAVAARLAQQIRSVGTRLVTTRAVLVEIGNSLSRRRFRATAIQIIADLESDERIEILELTQDLYTLALNLYRSRPDKEWGLTDCASFVVMWERGITDALTADGHFRQAGFRPLLSSSFR